MSAVIYTHYPNIVGILLTAASYSLVQLYCRRVVSDRPIDGLWRILR